MSYVNSVRARAKIGKGALAALVLSLGVTGAAVSEAATKSNTVRECLRTPLVHFDGSVVDAAIATDSLSTLVTAVSAAGLVDALSAPGWITVFAPTNDAFAALPEGVLTTLLGDPQGALTDVLTYHVLPRAIDARRALRLSQVKTLQGQKLFLKNSRRHGAKVNQSTFSCQGVLTDNGVVWVIDSVLLPQFFAN